MSIVFVNSMTPQRDMADYRAALQSGIKGAGMPELPPSDEFRPQALTLEVPEQALQTAASTTLNLDGGVLLASPALGQNAVVKLDDEGKGSFLHDGVAEPIQATIDGNYIDATLPDGRQLTLRTRPEGTLALLSDEDSLTSFEWKSGQAYPVKTSWTVSRPSSLAGLDVEREPDGSLQSYVTLNNSETRWERSWEVGAEYPTNQREMARSAAQTVLTVFD